METTKRGAWQIVLAAGVMLAASSPAGAFSDPPTQGHRQAHPQDQSWMRRIDRLPDDGPWRDDDPPYLFDGQWLRAEQSMQTQRPVQIRQAAGIQVPWPHTLTLAGAIENAPGAVQGLRKTGHGTLELSAANHYRGNTELYQGTLRLAHGAALGNPLRALAASTGTRLAFAPGIHVRHGLQFNPLPTPPGLALEAGDGPWEPQAAQWVVASGSAAYTGELIGGAALRKLGQGRLLLAGNAAVYDGSLDLAEGGVGLYALFGGAVTVRQGALLGGNGGVRSLVVDDGGWFAPGVRGIDAILGDSVAGSGIGASGLGGLADMLVAEPMVGMNHPDALAAAYGMSGFLAHDPWAFRIQQSLALAQQAVMRIQAAPDGRASLVRVGGVARLGGTLLVLPVAGDWPLESRFVVLEAGQIAADSQFAQVAVLPWQAANADMPDLQAALAYDDQRVLLTLARAQDAGPDPDLDGGPDPEPPGKPEPPGTPEPPPPPEPEPEPLPDSSPQNPQPVPPQEPTPPAPDTPPTEQPVTAPVGGTAAPPVIIASPPTWRASTHAAAIRSQVLSDSRFLRQAVLSRHAQADDPVFAGKEAIAWGQAYGASGQRRGAQDADGKPGPDGARAGRSDRRSLQGVVLGIDRLFGHGWLAGAYLGLQQARWRQQANAAQARLRTVQGGIVGERRAGPWRVAIGAAAGTTAVSAQSAGVLPDGWATGTAAWQAMPTPPSGERYRITTRQLFLGLQYGMRHADWLLTPFMQLAWVWQSAPTHIQAGEGLRVVVAKARDHVRVLDAGFRLQHRAAWGRGEWQWHAMAALQVAHAPAFSAHWQGELDGWPARGRGLGVGMARRAVRLQAGLDYRVDARVRLGLLFEGLRGAGLRDGAGLLRLQWQM